MASDKRLWFTHKCRICSYLFVTEKDLVQHEMSHNIPDFSCETCSMAFGDAEQLNTHIGVGCSALVEGAGIRRQHICKACGEIFSVVRDLYKHYVERHMDSTCGNARSVKSLTASTGSTRLSLCSTCGARFSGAASLKVHLWKAHNLNISQQSHFCLQQKQAADNVDTVDEPPAVRRLPCDVEKPYKCSMCNWAFKYDFSLNSHMKGHAEKQRLLSEMIRANGIESQTMSMMQPCIGQPAATPEQTSLPPVKRTVVYLRVKRAAVKKPKSSSCANLTDGCPDQRTQKRVRLSEEAEYAIQKDAISSENDVTSEDASSQHLNQQSNLGTFNDDTSDQLVISGERTPEPQPVFTTLCSTGNSIQSAHSDDALVEINQPAVRHYNTMCSRDEELPRYACKLCSFRCRYDFSYMAHLNQHAKLKELEIDDLHTHMVAVGPPASGIASMGNVSSSLLIDQQVGYDSMFLTHPNVAAPGEFAMQMLGDAGHLAIVQASQLTSSDGVNYILLCPGNLLQNSAAGHISDSNSSAYQMDSTIDGVHLADHEDGVVVDNSACQALEIQGPIVPADETEECNGVVSDMPLLGSSDGETYYIINEDEMQYQIDGTGGICTEVSYQDENSGDSQPASLCPQQDGTPLLVTELEQTIKVESDSGDCDDDACSCYFCNETFTCKSLLQEHLMRLHINVS